MTLRTRLYFHFEEVLLAVSGCTRVLRGVRAPSKPQFSTPALTQQVSIDKDSLAKVFASMDYDFILSLCNNCIINCGPRHTFTSVLNCSFFSVRSTIIYVKVAVH